MYGWNGSKQQPLYGYSDSDWGNDVNDRRSVTGWVYLLHDGAVSLYSDSQGAIALGKNPEHHKHTKHIDIQHHYVREQVAAGTVVSPYISTDDMVADILTKPLAAERHVKLAREMGVRAITPRAHSSGSVEESE